MPLSLWHMANVMPDLQLPSQTQSIAALWPVPNYTACNRGMCVWTTCPASLHDGRCIEYQGVVVCLKIIGKEFQKNYYKTILRQINTEETFLPFTVVTNKDCFSRKRSICENLLSWYMWFISMVIGANHRLDILSGAICQILLVNIVYLLVKLSNTQYILS